MKSVQDTHVVLERVLIIFWWKMDSDNLNEDGSLTEAMKTEAKPSACPRIEGLGEKCRYEFSSPEDLLQCLDDGTLVFKVTIIFPRTKGEKKPNKQKVPLFSLKGIFYDRTPGKIFFALKQNQVNNCVDNGKKISYPLKINSETSNNFASIQNKYDTNWTWHGILQHLEPHLEVLAQKYYPSYCATLHCSNDFKFNRRPNTRKKLFKKNEKGESVETVVETEWKFSDVLNQSGRVLLELGNPWLFPNDNFGNVLMGCATKLAPWKFLTDAERDLVREHQATERKRKAAENKDGDSSKLKRSRKITKNPIIEEEKDTDDMGAVGADLEDIDTDAIDDESDLP